jgi:hypothetical protein
VPVPPWLARGLKERLKIVPATVRPAGNFDYVALAIEMVVDGVCVSDEVALVAGEQSVDSIAVVVFRVAVKDVLLWRDEHPEVSVSAALLCLHQHAGRVGAQVRLLIGILKHSVDERLGQLSELLMPGAHRGLRQSQTFASVDILEPRQRLVILPAPHDRVSEHARAGNTTIDWQLDRRRRQHLGGRIALASLAHELLVDELDDDVGRRAPLQHLALLLADQFECVQAFPLDLRG